MFFHKEDFCEDKGKNFMMQKQGNEGNILH